jgi:RNA polymerase sigma-70 factor (ECF subfamily)
MDTPGLVGRVLDGDTERYADLVRAHQKEVWKVVCAGIGDFKTAEELVHQTFVNAYLRLDRFDRSADFGVWLKAIARNLVRQELRTRVREGRLLELYGARLEEASEEREDRVAEALQECRKKLPERGAETLDLRYGQALGFEAIARSLGKTVEAARQHLQRLRLQLRDCIRKRLAGS